MQAAQHCLSCHTACTMLALLQGVSMHSVQGLVLVSQGWCLFHMWPRYLPVLCASVLARDSTAGAKERELG
jgi:hypothetical protein